MDTDYINGTFDKDGNLVIRKLNDSELKMLDKFYKETYCTNFDDNNNLYENKLYHLDSAQLRELKREYKKYDLINSLPLKQRVKLVEMDFSRLNELCEEYDIDADDIPSLMPHRFLYDENNSRNHCIYNKSKYLNKMNPLNDECYDTTRDFLVGFKNEIEANSFDKNIEKSEWNVKTNDRQLELIDEEIYKQRLKNINKSELLKGKNNS